MRPVRVIVIASTFLAAAAAPGPSQTKAWSGSWTLNPALSKLMETTFRITRVGDAYHFDFGAAQFDIRDDGAFHPTIPGRLTSIKPIGVRTWYRVHRVNGVDVDRSTLRITPDERRLVIDTDAMTPHVGPQHSTENYQRVGAGQGLAGTWRSTSAGAGVAQALRLEVLADGRIRWEMPADGNYFLVAPNGPPAINRGPRSVSNATMSLRQTSPVEMRWTVMLGGRPYSEGVDRLESEHRLIETTWTDQHPNDRQRAVYDRQSEG